MKDFPLKRYRHVISYDLTDEDVHLMTKTMYLSNFDLTLSLASTGSAGKFLRVLKRLGKQERPTLKSLHGLELHPS